jgi:Zn-dependent protease/predicted transcriptional regulator
MFESALRIGSVRGIRIGVHYTWIVIFLLLSTTLYTLFRTDHPEWAASTALVTAIVTALLFFSSIVLHELGHSIVALARGIEVRSITLFIFGGVAQSEREADTPLTEFLVAIAGPAVSLALAGLFWLLYNVFLSISIVVAEAANWLATINLMVAIFNMIPGFPLDGGRVFRSLVWGLSGNAVRGMNWAVAGGKIVAYGLMGFGVLIVIQTGLILNGLWMFGIGWFLLISAQASGQAFHIRRVFGHHKVRDYMRRDVPSATIDTSVEKWVTDYVFTRGERASLVRDDKTVVGLVTLTDCKKQPRDAWGRVTLAEVMTPVKVLHTVSPEDEIGAVLELMAARSLNQIPVVERDNVTGWIDRDRLIKVVRLYMESER